MEKVPIFIPMVIFILENFKMANILEKDNLNLNNLVIIEEIFWMVLSMDMEFGNNHKI